MHCQTLLSCEIFSSLCVTCRMHLPCASILNHSIHCGRLVFSTLQYSCPCERLSHPAFLQCSFVSLTSCLSLFQPVASTINTLAGALYKVFSASPDEARNEMRQACFDYLSLGGVFSNGPISLLSGLNPRPLSLVAHFFAVAIYGVGRLMIPLPSPKRMWIGARLVSVSFLVSYHFFQTLVLVEKSLVFLCICD